MCNRNFFTSSSSLDNKKLFFTNSVSDTESGREVTEKGNCFLYFRFCRVWLVFLLFKLAHNRFRMRRSDWWIFFIEWKIVKGKIKPRRKRRSRKRKRRSGRYVDWFIVFVAANALRVFERSWWTNVFVLWFASFSLNSRKRWNLWMPSENWRSLALNVNKIIEDGIFSYSLEKEVPKTCFDNWISLKPENPICYEGVFQFWRNPNPFKVCTTCT